MLVLLSPAKNLNSELDLTKYKSLEFSQPKFIAETQSLVKFMQNFAPHELADLQKTNDKIAQLNFTRWQNWQDKYTIETSLPAIFAFAGPVFQNFDAYNMSLDDLNIAQNKVRILSGLYGILKPLDLMQNYRLEMGTKFDKNLHDSLYKFWGTKISHALMQELQMQPHKFIINLASNEYFKSVNQLKKHTQVINIEFKQQLANKFKTIVIYTKMARGKMARYIVQNDLNNIEAIKHFDQDGYKFNPSLSDELNWTFTRQAN